MVSIILLAEIKFRAFYHELTKNIIHEYTINVIYPGKTSNRKDGKMCGFVCYIPKKEKGNLYSKNMKIKIQNKVKDAAEVISHRGPDDSGYYSDKNISLGFKRLSIIDLEGGKQPLSYFNNRYQIVFNGEIYNYLELRNELINTGVNLNTESDTEIIVALYHQHGSEIAHKLRGMFSFIIWDSKLKKLFGARDYFGIKPLYYSDHDEFIVFCSEKKALLQFIETDLDYETLQHYLTYQYPPEPNTMDKNIKKIPPGTCFYYDTKSQSECLSLNKYFSLKLNPNKNYINQEEKLVSQVKVALEKSVKLHMRSDVPVGAFLSSGIDSTGIVALAKKIHPDIKTFTSGFSREGYNEADIAKDTAEKIGVDHYTKTVTAEDIMRDLPTIIWHMDDPVADPAAIPLYYVSQEASKQVKVVLSGEGADELFGGYNIYREPGDLKKFTSLPITLKKSLFYLSRILPDGVKGKEFISRGILPIEKRYYGNARIFKELEKAKFYQKFDSGKKFYDITQSYYKEAKNMESIEKMQYIDLNTWLSGDILIKADRMTMAHSLELRVPFLDKSVFNIAKQIPSEFKVTPETTKYILRKALETEIPDSIINRKKLGFPVPIRLWLKEEMFSWARTIIKNSDTDYLFNKQAVLKLLEDHRKNKGDYSRKIWTVLTFMIWHKNMVVERKAY
ncbi:asparagine synthase (glutamine-hydrolyzing) [Natranaerobius thermophilus JW/NM-WN-LF]|nr:asparagine synthase (glutamine-hydrolyzing) [Natranaerobius thermophilus]